jgi:hypothetical protein
MRLDELGADLLRRFALPVPIARSMVRTPSDIVGPGRTEFTVTPLPFAIFARPKAGPFC